ncbi:hypothetical protein BBO99_00006666 [Phytophthora kernoviae]|uniref:Helicase C-terminal domain-containing protein n=2 Tax=Phytophthora kernoviae TaxID=325452 RepID=A0A421FHJ3_9STRA|nr:hypothetical protein G195_008520 [Phytophthora kernoviae 00238/432]KAG2519982.1 hypothetical protein JM16_006928 [Phytophthora kernoviae]KAG2520451.1 hypothetical protein JM18_006801 [Phytophthora kernoviae]RLN44993.1 hypothetical protein BBI17_006163 [Phytophthora kernoviae]RLN77538.1 hypothetical protein BBO99_00006666 [Phytophthora kernoviae]
MGRAKRKSITQVSIESFVGSSAKRVSEDVQFKVPFLPLTAPEEPTPAAFRSEMPLYEHQSRSLHRMLQIESRDEKVAKFNFGMLDYFSTGGCLADAIGMGKTATMLALIVTEPRNFSMGANLLVAPSHLLLQWKLEVDKFVKDGEIDVVLGLRKYTELVENPATRRDISNRMLVLVGVEEAVKSKAYFYQFGKLFPLKLGSRANPLLVDPVALQDYKEAAKFVHKAYTGPLWVTPLHLPEKKWRRVIFEEVQDLVLPGKASRDCFIQLTHRCLNVWLITATPFPGKTESMYANNQLLGFKRLRLLPHDPAFDEIKRKLYLRNCAQVKQQAIADKIHVDETYIPVKLHPKELLLYKVERVLADNTTDLDVFALGDVDVLAAGGKEVEICRAIRSNVYSTVADCFEDKETSGLSRFFDESGETKAGFRMLYRHCQLGDEMIEPLELLLYYESEIEDYVLKHFNSMDKVARLCSTMESTLNERCPQARNVVEDQLRQVTECMELAKAEEVREKSVDKIPPYGSKISALVQYLRQLPTIKVVVFTMWDRALRVVDKALRLADISSAVFLQHQSSETKSAHVASFHTGETEVLLLNSLTSASGINLQVASHVIFLDPVGYSAMQASTLEQQAIGRVLRMGQTNDRVSVVRFIAEDTMEAALYDGIHEATQKAVAADDSFFDGERNAEDAYVCADFAAPVRRLVRMVAPADDGAEADDEEIQIEASMSIEEAINHRIEQAAAEGGVFDLTEDAPVDLEQQLAAAREHDALHQRKKRRSNDSAKAAVNITPNSFHVTHTLVKSEPERR